jgi:predicted hotdog family 3-hydroxylacyl-ACP dehydratase
MGENQICIQHPHSHWTYFVAGVVGSWSSTVHVTVENLPPGAVVTEAGVLPPGSNYTNPNGSTTLNGWVFVEFAPLPIGVYTAQMTASDGTQTLSDPVTISVKERCY